MTWYAPLATKVEKIVVGLMSGTSLDGIDAAVVRVSGCGLDTKVELLGYCFVPYDEEWRKQILAVCNPKTGTVDRICDLNVRLGERFAEAAFLAAKNIGIAWEEIDFISSHGQTIFHMPQVGATLQIGELAVIAERTGKVVVGDFRPHDLAVGGQGAPLVPYVDYLLFRDDVRGRVLLNIGGIANISVIPAGGSADDVFAFDTGPGNMIIDAFVSFETGGAETYDKNGNYAIQGKVEGVWLEELLRHPYYAKPIPKSTGRETFGEPYAGALWADAEKLAIPFVNRVATVTALTTHTIADSVIKKIKEGMKVDDVIVSGGGKHNRALMKALQELMPVLDVLPVDHFGISSDAKEAVAFAILGNEAIHRIPNQIPSATGANKRVVMGKVVLP